VIDARVMPVDTTLGNQANGGAIINADRPRRSLPAVGS
jgi:hypothetical protein